MSKHMLPELERRIKGLEDLQRHVADAACDLGISPVGWMSKFQDAVVERQRTYVKARRKILGLSEGCDCFTYAVRSHQFLVRMDKQVSVQVKDAGYVLKDALAKQKIIKDCKDSGHVGTGCILAKGFVMMVTLLMGSHET